MKLLNQSILALSALGLATVAMAADPLANTTWQTYDNGQPKALVKITESNGVLTGKIISTNRAEGKKFVGRTVMSGLKAEGAGKYSGGQITDPENNKTYRLTAELKGSDLKLKGHLGPFSRSQVWKKQ
ncbi:DUF2147 domain-containing protein [Psychrobacter sanguinis]|jgi:uncharacterized protein (DUF2147 family)|uniref:DUF2147 domain-containing protein n=1 Tax=Psychrobacter sanguinis TaxID=861445 RepID=UPI00020C7E7A|nr:DUF2147 domain-containing protein [Psychrobacter sanguinis]EGK12517.1 hypothetical protein HMPREF9373_1547 [Psychrobacter sp. 1501(2011)]MCC3309177.1 DUF2147 domain-containing protein [Psychrobacter sanguinis]MCC3345597.1 DUF2147 domain-containing protein [Psychrobacter sanguinis]MCD9151884.1 DUF2147 domain-containing protein [Psychrobacter sanguinis]UEC26458.1 DUF2147 domain-containing protein [Psychrobacter sanguinis]